MYFSYTNHQHSHTCSLQRRRTDQDLFLQILLFKELPLAKEDVSQNRLLSRQANQSEGRCLLPGLELKTNISGLSVPEQVENIKEALLYKSLLSLEWIGKSTTGNCLSCSCIITHA